MQSESKYDHNNDMKSNSPTISTISNNEQFGSNNAIYKSQAVRQRHKSAAKKPAKKRTKDDDVGICEDILQLLRKFWSTRQTEVVDKEKNPDLYVKITMRELIVYLIFLLVLCLITFCMTSPMVFYFTNVLINQFTGGSTGDEPYMSFTQVSTMDDVWRYLQDPFIGGMYTDWYINSNLTEDLNSYVLNENRLLGLPRLRMLKVKNNSCIVHDDFKEEIKQCFDSYSEFVEDREPFGLYYTQNITNDTAWFYQTEKELKGSTSTVQADVNKYNGGGYVKLLSKNADETLAIIKELKDNLWITRGTRVVFIDFTLYNANLNLFCQVRLTFEFPATGGVVPSYMFRPSKLIRYVTPLDYFVMACEIIFLVFIIYYTIEELIEIKNHGKEYFKTLWNILDIVIILVAYVCVAFNIYRQVKVNEVLDSLLQNEDQFKDFEFLCYWQMQFNNAVAGIVFIAWMKIFKYTSFNKTMTQLTETLARCAKDVAGFAIMFFIIFFAYAQLGYLIFGTQVYDFSTFQQSIYTLFRIILGDFDYEAIERAQRVLGPIYFLTYVFFVFFVLLNMFLAIINDTYSEVKSEIVKSEIELSNFIKRGYNKVMEKYNLKRDRIIDIRRALAKADLNRDNQIDFDEWRNELRAQGYAETEIATLFAKYDVDGDRVLSAKEQRDMYQDLAKQDEELREALKSLDNAADETKEAEEEGEKKNKRSEGVPFEDYNSLSERIDKMETSLDGIVTKIDSVLMKLDTAERTDSRATPKTILISQSPNSQSNC